MKALVALNGAGNLWSDQPPFLRLCHVALISLLGPAMGALRGLELFFSGALLISFLTVLRRSSGWLSGVVALLLLVFSSSYMRLSAACLVGLPAYSWAVMACACLVCGVGFRPQIWVALSGFLLGLGAQTKLSALLVLPALLAWLWCLRITSKECPWSRSQAIMHWLGGFLVSFLGILLLSPQSLTGIVTAHWGNATRDAFLDNQASHLLIGRLLLENWLLTIPALLGLLTGIVNRRTHALLPGIWLLTALLVHLWHRPFWQHHFLHISVPMAWLAGLFIGEMVEQFKAVTWGRLMGKTGSPLTSSLSPARGEGRAIVGRWHRVCQSRAAAWCWVLLPSLFLSAFIVELPERWSKATAFLRVDDSKDWECVRVMKHYKAQTKWVFADDALYPFHAGILTPPEIAVLSHKRLRAGLITQPELLNLLVHYRAEQILVRRHVFNERFMRYVEQHYTPVFEHGSLQLFIRNDLVKKQPEAAKTAQASASTASLAGGGNTV